MGFLFVIAVACKKEEIRGVPHLAYKYRALELDPPPATHATTSSHPPNDAGRVHSVRSEPDAAKVAKAAHDAVKEGIGKPDMYITVAVSSAVVKPRRAR